MVRRSTKKQINVFDTGQFDLMTREMKAITPSIDLFNTQFKNEISKIYSLVFLTCTVLSDNLSNLHTNNSFPGWLPNARK